MPGQVDSQYIYPACMCFYIGTGQNFHSPHNDHLLNFQTAAQFLSEQMFAAIIMVRGDKWNN